MAGSGDTLELLFSQYNRHYERMGNFPPNYAEVKAYPEKYRICEDWLPSDPEAAILDVGCGWGTLLLSLWASGYRNLTGVDISERMCTIAKQNLPSEITIYCADAVTFLADKQQTYDLILLFDILEHMTLEKAFALLKQCHFALVPGGSVVIRTPNMANLLASYSRYLDITHVQGYTEYSLFQLLDLVGFVNHKVIKTTLSMRGWRLTGKREFLNELLHRVLFGLRGQNPRPTTYAYNLVVQSFKG
jgi:2-polyprenyl-3-methyl-5-hydroxy-6-metoxy-1,4-benzoquinol methylase